MVLSLVEVAHDHPASTLTSSGHDEDGQGEESREEVLARHGVVEGLAGVVRDDDSEKEVVQSGDVEVDLVVAVEGHQDVHVQGEEDNIHLPFRDLLESWMCLEAEANGWVVLVSLG